MSPLHRRRGLTIKIQFPPGGQIFDITYNHDPRGHFYECFYSPTSELKEGSDFQHLLSDSCIAVSKLIEAGFSFAELTFVFGENRAPGAVRGPASSFLGAICVAGAKLQADFEIEYQQTHEAIQSGRTTSNERKDT